MDTRHSDLLGQGKLAARQGRWNEAVGLAREAASASPDDVETSVFLGVSLSHTGDPTEALKSFEHALGMQPEHAAALNWAAMLSQTHGDPAVALTYAMRAARLQPHEPEAAFRLGVCYAQLGRFEEALPPIERAVQAQSHRSKYLYALGNVTMELGRKEQAVHAFRRALEFEPSEEGFVKLMDLLISLSNPAEALTVGQRAARTLPQSARIQVLLGRASVELHEEEQATVFLEKAMQIDPSRAEPYVLQGSRSQRVGDFEGAENYYRKAIEVEPYQGISYFGIVSSRKVTEDDREFVGRMEALAADPRMPTTQKAALLYALGKSFDNLGDYAKAIRYYDEANAVHKDTVLRNRPFSAEICAQENTQRIKLYGEALEDKLRSTADKSDLPVFVLGMMRSGTTLLEQILSCHPEIGGAGELPHWADYERRHVDLYRERVDVPAIAKSGREYVQFLKNKVPGYKHVTDKNPANVMAVGLLHAALPNAKIIHTVRNPVDTALSMWITMVDSPPNFCCDRRNIVSMLRQYQRVSRSWKSTLPTDRYLEVSYEALVSDPEAEIRNVLAFLGLEWNEACLHPEANQKSITTPSFWQARQSFYGSSAGRWKRYEPWIPEFLELASDEP